MRADVRLPSLPFCARRTASAIFLGVVCLVVVPHHVAVAKNPSSEGPKSGLDAHNTIEGASELVNSLYALYVTEEANLLKMRKTLETNPARLSAKLIESSSGKVWKAKRDAEHLILMGEPAGQDLSKKFEDSF